jgi:hypothetical protein
MPTDKQNLLTAFADNSSKSIRATDMQDFLAAVKLQTEADSDYAAINHTHDAATPSNAGFVTSTQYNKIQDYLNYSDSGKRSLVANVTGSVSLSNVIMLQQFTPIHATGEEKKTSTISLADYDLNDTDVIKINLFGATTELSGYLQTDVSIMVNNTYHDIYNNPGNPFPAHMSLTLSGNANYFQVTIGEMQEGAELFSEVSSWHNFGAGASISAITSIVLTVWNWTDDSYVKGYVEIISS